MLDLFYLQCPIHVGHLPNLNPVYGSLAVGILVRPLWKYRNKASPNCHHRTLTVSELLSNAALPLQPTTTRRNQSFVKQMYRRSRITIKAASPRTKSSDNHNTTRPASHYTHLIKSPPPQQPPNFPPPYGQSSSIQPPAVTHPVGRFGSRLPPLHRLVPGRLASWPRPPPRTPACTAGRPASFIVIERRHPALLQPGEEHVQRMFYVNRSYVYTTRMLEETAACRSGIWLGFCLWLDSESRLMLWAERGRGGGAGEWSRNFIGVGKCFSEALVSLMHVPRA